jgi:hypothetical protein
MHMNARLTRPGEARSVSSRRLNIQCNAKLEIQGEINSVTNFA